METVANPRSRPLAPEDQARADFYALLARLFADPPDAALLAAIADAAPIGDDAPAAMTDEGSPSLPRRVERVARGQRGDGSGCRS